MADIYDAIGILSGWAQNYAAEGNDSAAEAMRLARKVIHDFVEDPDRYHVLERQMEAAFRGESEMQRILAVEASAEIYKDFRETYFGNTSYEDIYNLPDEDKLAVFDQMLREQWE